MNGTAFVTIAGDASRVAWVEGSGMTGLGVTATIPAPALWRYRRRDPQSLDGGKT